MEATGGGLSKSSMALQMLLLALLPATAAGCNVTAGLAYPDSHSSGASVMGKFAGGADGCTLPS